MDPEKSSSAPKIKDKMKVSKQFDKFAKTVAKMKREGKWFDLLEALLNQSRIVYIDPEKKYVIVQTSFLETASKKVGVYKNRVQELEKIQHERNARIKELELEVARMKREENQQIQLKEKNQKKMKRKMKQIQQKLNKQQQSILSLSEKLQSHNKIELLRHSQETKNKNIQINKRSVQCQTLYCDLNIPENSPFTYSKCAAIHIEPAKQCFRSCKQIYTNNIQSLIQSLKKLSMDLEPKLQSLTDINDLIEKYQRKIRDIERQNNRLQNDIQKMRSDEAIQRNQIWSRCIKMMINEIKVEWEKIGEPLNKEGLWQQAKSNDNEKSLVGMRSNQEQSKQQ